ncbi:MAG TPA: hypothetical protein VFA71_03795 [Terriglobales bacterium]|nr:hypothetical protein [Terriglobales bacterium]
MASFHIHSGLTLWLLFTIGVLLHGLQIADDQVRLQKKFATMRAFFSWYRVPLAVRSALNSVLFWLWTSHSDYLAKLLALAGINLALELPVTGGFALLFGLFIDWGLAAITARIPFLQNAVPTINGDNHATQDKT